ncbi:putative RNA polymerase II subunit B1 CTD phosphatase Rpap2 isoform X2 [Ooceraea biroi]|uniref:RNA polymerase II subunit B1 CTD phosphatase RPAP2 homolog n=1 Tax=Ooceraea biroi TaxID=2015173 RepID=A0A026W147_OOCBI|nr:putative RNA polymerase II subunit B1 CTD phosphatase Rpap2 isoform X2 [Ooceraea biroi]EZA49306.1 RNA polymerase II subunit B1 CTD phosphatase Rpap2 [Ooceraea biroi]
MSTAKKFLNEKRKLKNMSKVELQQVIIMKKQCDAKALAIVEQLLEPDVNSDWLLQNLRFLKKCHMEDVIEERTILKLCGYVLCSKPLTVIIQQQYHISTRSNKVYDVSKRKKFCSSSCYGASNYLLEQMLDSPLWLRDKEDISVFKILSRDINRKFTQCGEEVNILSNNHSQGITDNNKNKTDNNKEYNTIEQTKEDVLCDTSSSFKEEDTYSSCSVDDVNAEKEDVHVKEISINTESQELLGCEINPSKLHKNPINEDCSLQESIKENHNDDTQKLNIKPEVERQSEEILHSHEHDTDTENTNFECENVITCNKDNKTLQSQPDGTDNKTDGIKTLQPQLDRICSSSTIISSDSRTKHRKNRDADKSKKTKKFKQKEANNVVATTDVYCNLIARVEQSVREWVTENTLCLLLGKEDEKNQLLESLIQQERYQKLCKKLDRLQLEDKMRDHTNLERDTLKPLPVSSVLQEEGKKIELKVRAFYAGETTFPLSGDSSKESENKDDNGESVLPLTEKCAPNVIRRRIFLDKLNTILPDLLRTLANNANVSSMMQYTHNNERYFLIKILVSTFNLSAGNIIFKTGEWTLVGLIVIKMLSFIDVKLQSLLHSKQASMYTSMMLTLYKLDGNYLDRFMMEVTNSINASELNDRN